MKPSNVDKLLEMKGINQITYAFQLNQTADKE